MEKVPSRSTAPGCVIPSPVQPPVIGECVKMHDGRKDMHIIAMSEEVLAYCAAPLQTLVLYVPQVIPLFVALI